MAGARRKERIAEFPAVRIRIAFDDRNGFWERGREPDGSDRVAADGLAPRRLLADRGL